jgi:ABC-type thiamine transport system ATPase subunit
MPDSEGKPLAVTVPCNPSFVSGASGAGKSTARRLVAGELKPGVECVELHDVVAMPRAPTLAWRQRATEAVVCT